MSSLWSPGASGSWTPARIAEQGVTLDIGVIVTRQGSGSDAVTALLARAGLPVRVNGQPVVGGLCVLAHRDEIVIGARRFYYSAESTPVRAAFRLEGTSRRPVCPVCRGPLKDGEVAVACPGCGRWYHQADAVEGQRTRACWTYATECRFCRHPTALTGQPTWTPEQEDAHG